MVHALPPVTGHPVHLLIMFNWSKIFALRILSRPRRGKRTRQRYRTVIFKVDAIGDFVIALSVIRCLIRKYGEEHCCLVVSSVAAELAAREFPAAHHVVVAVPPYGGLVHHMLPQLLRDRRTLSAIEGDHLVSLRHQRSDCHNLLLSWIRAGRTYGLEDHQPVWMNSYTRTRLNYSFTDTIMVPPPNTKSDAADGALCRELQLHKALATRVLGREITTEEIIPSFASVQPTSGEVLLAAPFSGDPIKDYPQEQFVRCLVAIHAETPLPILLAGSPSQHDALHSMFAALERKGVMPIELCGDLSVADYVERVAEAKAVLTMDSSTAHIAAAFDKPTVAILGGGHYGQFAPWHRSGCQVWLTHSMDCFQCDWHCMHPEPYCITRIEPADVCRTMKRLLQGREK